MLTEIRADLTRVAADFDAASLPPTEASKVVEDAAAIAKMAATVQALAAARVAEADGWRRDGHRSAADYLAGKSGTSAGAAREALATAERLSSQPVVEAAARRGELSAQQLSVITGAAAADPAAADRLVALAQRASLGELKAECERVRAATDVDAEGSYQRVHRERFARQYRCADGAAEIRCHGTPDAIADIWSVVQGWTDRIFRAAREDGRRESPEAYAFDAVLSVARAARDGCVDGKKPPTPTKVIVRVDWDALVRGWPLDGERCEIAGVGPVPVSVVEAMLDANAFLAAVITKGDDVVNVAHLGRRFTAKQVTGMEWRDPTCTVLGCNCAWRLEKDHRKGWARTKVTMLAASDRLCDHHHFLKTVHGWRLVDGSGKRPMMPPDQPDELERPDVDRVQRGLQQMVDGYAERRYPP